MAWLIRDRRVESRPFGPRHLLGLGTRRHLKGRGGLLRSDPRAARSKSPFLGPGIPPAGVSVRICRVEADCLDQAQRSPCHNLPFDPTHTPDHHRRRHRSDRAESLRRNPQSLCRSRCCCPTRPRGAGVGRTVRVKLDRSVIVGQPFAKLTFFRPGSPRLSKAIAFFGSSRMASLKSAMAFS